MTQKNVSHHCWLVHRSPPGWRQKISKPSCRGRMPLVRSRLVVCRRLEVEGSLEGVSFWKFSGRSFVVGRNLKMFAWSWKDCQRMIDLRDWEKTLFLRGRTFSGESVVRRARCRFIFTDHFRARSRCCRRIAIHGFILFRYRLLFSRLPLLFLDLYFPTAVFWLPPPSFGHRGYFLDSPLPPPSFPYSLVVAITIFSFGLIFLYFYEIKLRG